MCMCVCVCVYIYLCVGTLPTHLEDEVIAVGAVNEAGRVDGQDVLGERARLVRAQRGHARELFNGRQPRHHRVLLRHK